MEISIEISMYPLDKQFGTPILDFIDRLKQKSGLKVATNEMSTQVYGPYDIIMEEVMPEIRKSFETDTTVVMVMKMVNKRLD